MKSKPIGARLRCCLFGGILLVSCVPAAWAATLWSVPDSYLGTGYFFGPGAYMIPTPLFPAMIRNLAFTSDRDFVTPFWNNGADAPNIAAETDFPPVDGRLSDGTRINENVDLGTFILAGTRFLPAVGEGGEFSGQQVAVAMVDGNLVMVMDLILDLGIGPRGVIRLPLYGSTGTLTIPGPQVTASGLVGPKQAGPLPTGETISGRVGDFNGDGCIDGTLVAVGVMPLSSPIYPGQPFAFSRNFETDVPIDGVVHGSAEDVDKAYGVMF
ncbi:MAG: hypothetical protein LGR52_13870 [Candidatus Thiosymbion ectosymbiont of Robbea hypermnestra]|nr:hypothetical protein [Candidatus Thiosymbion ectosymbiont of Robbea hypermnestra]